MFIHSMFYKHPKKIIFICPELFETQFNSLTLTIRIETIPKELSSSLLRDHDSSEDNQNMIHTSNAFNHMRQIYKTLL